MRLNSWILKGLITVVLVAGIIQLQRTRLQSTLNPGREMSPEQAAALQEQSAFQLSLIRLMPDFGFDNLTADWVFLNFLQYFGNSDERQLTGYGLSADFFEIILDKDPYSYRPYLYLSSSVSLFAGQPERAVALQERGLQSLTPNLPPNSYFIWRNKGIDEILFLGDYEAATRSHEMAADWAAQSAYPEAEEDQYSLRRTAEFLAQNPDSTNIQISAWVQVLSYAPDDKTRAKAIQNIEALGYEITPSEGGGYSVQPKSPES
jgi:hypothetical protein